MTQPIDLVPDRLDAVRRSGDSGHQWTTCCPAHDDAHQSLSVGVDKDGVVLFWCHKGCQTADVIAALGLTFADLKPEGLQRDILPFRRDFAKKKHKSEPPKSKKELIDLLLLCGEDPDCRRGVARFAKQLGLSEQILWDLGCRWKRVQLVPKSDRDPGELWFPERDGTGEIIGIGIRPWDGRKGFVEGGNRGLVFIADVLDRPGPIYLVEGLTDTAVLVAMGLCALGRPSNNTGLSFLAKLLASVAPDREIIVVGENDQKPNGDWPGKEGAEYTAGELAELLKRPIMAVLVPLPFKDSREWFAAPSVVGIENTAASYQQSLVYLATFPVRPPDVTDEELLAAAIPISSCSHYTYPDETCQHPRHVLLKHTKNHKLRHVLVRCGASSCLCCFKRKKRLRYESLLRHFASTEIAKGSLYCSTQALTKKQWDTIRRSIKRRNGNFVCFRQPGNLFVIIATLPFSTSEPLPFDRADEFLKKAIDDAVVEGRGKPFFSSSTEWAMVREKKTSLYENIGIVKMPPQAIKRLCHKMLGKGHYKQNRPADNSLLLDGFIDYAAPDPDNDTFVQTLLGNIDSSDLFSSLTSDSDNMPPNSSDTNGFPPGIDDYFAWCMNPTG